MPERVTNVLLAFMRAQAHDAPRGSQLHPMTASQYVQFSTEFSRKSGRMQIEKQQQQQTDMIEHAMNLKSIDNLWFRIVLLVTV